MFSLISSVGASLAAFVVTLSLGYLIVVAAAAAAAALARGGRRERAVDAYEALAVSRFTIPVSIVVPVVDDSAPLAASIAALLGLNYPELEVIVVADPMAEASMHALKTEWSLEPKELFYRRMLATGPVRRIYSSQRDGRLTVVEKAAAGRADALNCGSNLARFRYVVTVAPGVVCDADALLRLMSPALRDPAAVLAVTSYVERTPGGSESAAPPEGEWTRAWDDYQRLASIRSWMMSRLAWHQRRCGLPPVDAVAAWRRDAVLELGGFSLTAADAELDLLVRLQISHPDRAGRVVRTSEVFGHAGTVTVGRAAGIAGRRQRAVLEAIRRLRKTAGANPARRAMVPVLAVELLTPAAQAIAVAFVLGGAVAGVVDWSSPLLLLLMLTFGYGLISASALLLRGGTPGAPSRTDLRRLLVRAPLEFAVYRPALLWSRARGSFQR
jgi:hypothetical protein